MKSSSTIKSFDGLRGLAALLVATYHFHLPIKAIEGFYLFVDLFFMLSGFVIFRAYQNDLQSVDRLANFVLRRIGRLYPLHIFAAVLFIASTNILQVAKLVLVAVGLGHILNSPGAPHFAIPSFPAVLTNLAMLQGMGPFWHLKINGPSWSISTEFYTYLIMAVCVALFKGRLRSTAFVLLAAGGMSAAIYHSVSADQCLVNGHCMEVFLDYAILRCVGGFYLGVLAYQLTQRFPRQLAAASDIGQVTALLFAAAVMVASAYYPGAAFLAHTAFALLILTLATDTGPIASVLKTRPFQFLGATSYSIYLVHIGFTAMGNVMAKNIPFVAKCGVFVAYLGVVLIVASFTYKFIEEPTRDATRLLSERWFRSGQRQDRTSLLAE